MEIQHFEIQQNNHPARIWRGPQGARESRLIPEQSTPHREDTQSVIMYCVDGWVYTQRKGWVYVDM